MALSSLVTKSCKFHPFYLRRVIFQHNVIARKFPLPVYTINSASFFSKTPTHVSDDMDLSQKLIYKCNYKNQIILSYATVVPCVAFVYFELFNCLYTMDTSNVVFGEPIFDPLFFNLGGSIFGTFLVFALRRLLFQSFIRIYYDEKEDSFTGIVYNTFLIKTKLKFYSTQIKEKKAKPILKELAGNYYVNNRPFFILPSDFIKPIYHNHMLSEERRKFS